MVFKIFLIIICLLLPLTTQGAVFINEIAWMGTETSYNDEWIELYNNTNNSISFDGWVLKAEDGTPEINLAGMISANGFYLLERTDDETVLGISADLIYTGALGNNGENLKIYDNSGNLIDEVNCREGWLAGNNETKQTMERTSSGSWADSKNPGGTPKTNNSTPGIKPLPPEPELLPELEPESEPEKKTTPITYPTGIVFNEILPSPEGPDQENEWIVTIKHSVFL